MLGVVEQTNPMYNDEQGGMIHTFSRTKGGREEQSRRRRVETVRERKKNEHLQHRTQGAGTGKINVVWKLLACLSSVG